MNRATPPPDDEGSAIVEFVSLTMLLLIPVVYLVTALGRIEAASYAAEGAARHGALVVAQARDASTAQRRLHSVVDLALQDQGLPAAGDATPEIQLQCSQTPCQRPNGTVAVSVRMSVALPGVPAFLQAAIPLRVPVSATSVASVDEFRQ